MQDHTPPDPTPKDTTPRRRPPLGVLIGLVVVVITAGSATALFTWRTLSPSSPTVNFPELETPDEAEPVVPPVGTEADPTTPDPGTAQVPTATGNIYWVDDQGDRLALVPSTIDLSTTEPAAALQTAFANLMDGPSADGLSTTIPADTELLALTVESDGVHLNLSSEFTFGGGSASMIGRLAQVVYTATMLDPNAPVWLDIEGEPLTVLGGEGLLIRRPITRSDLAADFGVEAVP